MPHSVDEYIFQYQHAIAQLDQAIADADVARHVIAECQDTVNQTKYDLISGQHVIGKNAEEREANLNVLMASMPAVQDAWMELAQAKSELRHAERRTTVETERCRLARVVIHYLASTTQGVLVGGTIDR